MFWRWCDILLFKKKNCTTCPYIWNVGAQRTNFELDTIIFLIIENSEQKTKNPDEILKW